MKRFGILATTALMASASAVAAEGAMDVTCEEFNAMDRTQRESTMVEIDSGRAEAREMARGDMGQSESESGQDTLSVQADDDMSGGREEAREYARGDQEFYVQVVEQCETNPEMAVEQAMPPAASKES
ncbi:MAG: hypothetical protein RIG84_01345 [Roseovarius sp.]